MKCTLLAAKDLHCVIGINNELPWYFPEDLKRFKERTMGQTVIMGSNTWLSLPINKVVKQSLPGRKLYVISSKPESFWREHREPSAFVNVQFFQSLESAIAEANFHKFDHLQERKEVFIIGGGQIFKEALQKRIPDQLEITTVASAPAYQKDINIVTYFPLNVGQYGYVAKSLDVFKNEESYVLTYVRSNRSLRIK